MRLFLPADWESELSKGASILLAVSYITGFNGTGICTPIPKKQTNKNVIFV